MPTSIIELSDFKRIKNTSPEELVKIIEKDPLIVATILKTSNSSIFAFRSKVETLNRAINLLGTNFTISIAMSTLIQDTLKSNLNAYEVSTEKFLFTSSLATRIVNTWISSIDFDLSTELLVPAFLQETGKFVISEIIQEQNQTQEFLRLIDQTQDITFCEEKFTGYTCSRITANIFKNWSLGHNLIFTIGFVGNIKDCPKEYIKKVQILEVVKILCDIKNPLNDFAVEKAVAKVIEYNFDLEKFINSIDIIKKQIKRDS